MTLSHLEIDPTFDRPPVPLPTTGLHVLLKATCYIPCNQLTASCPDRRTSLFFGPNKTKSAAKVVAPIRGHWPKLPNGSA